MSNRHLGLGPLQILLGSGGGSNSSEAAIAVPDTAHMLPYKPKINAMPGEHPVPGKFPIHCCSEDGEVKPISVAMAK